MRRRSPSRRSPPCSPPSWLPAAAAPPQRRLGQLHRHRLSQRRRRQQPQGERADQGVQRRRTGRGMDPAADRAEQLRLLRLDPGGQPRRALLAGPRVQRAGDRTRKRQRAVDEKLRIRRPGPERGRRRRRPRLRRHRDLGLRARPGNRQAALVGAADPQRTGRHRHGAGLRGRDGLHLDRAVERRLLLRRRRRRHALGAGREDGEETVALRHGAEKPLGQTAGQRGRRRLVPAGLRRQGVDLLRRRQPGAVPRHRGRALGREPSRPQPLHRLDREDGREDRQDGLVLPADAARPLRLGPRRARRC